ncbi:BnaC03g30790D [Brassica napus]|uniref:BnaC03g30790D protein n=1 Tax=Brassica napus TaxID=3708 RepID=A0A078FYX8_BRANA|nr:BnaC03g30790D [Brassica napus]
MFEFSCVIENVRYYYGNKGFLWYDEKLKDWRTINGLSIEMADYSGKLLMIWDKYKQYKHHPEKKIWCALIAFEKRNNDDEVWGKVEWANIVLTVPNSCVLLSSEIRAV